MIDFAACAAASPELNFQWSANHPEPAAAAETIAFPRRL